MRRKAAADQDAASFAVAGPGAQHPQGWQAATAAARAGGGTGQPLGCLAVARPGDEGALRRFDQRTGNATITKEIDMTCKTSAPRRLQRTFALASVAIGALALSGSAHASGATPAAAFPHRASSPAAGALPPGALAKLRATPQRRLKRAARSAPAGASASTEITCNANPDPIGQSRVNFGTFIRPEAGLASQPVAFRFYYSVNGAPGGWTSWDMSIRSGLYQSTSFYLRGGYTFQYYLQWAWYSSGSWKVAGAWASGYRQLTTDGRDFTSSTCRT
jgi:hypothetical protein